jgi:rare lipoprotein A
MRLAARLLPAAAVLTLAACTTTTPPPRPAEDHTVKIPPNAGIYKVGQPYQVDNVWYYPREQPDYDETGIASWYGPTFYGKKTANGEMYDGNQLTAAHKTLPMPVNVRVTNLDNGKSLIVRVNDRGPYARGRIIDLSKRAAELLDVVQTGTARVRVTYLGRSDMNGAPPPSLTPPAIANALPPVPAGKVDSAARHRAGCRRGAPGQGRQPAGARADTGADVCRCPADRAGDQGSGASQHAPVCPAGSLFQAGECQGPAGEGGGRHPYFDPSTRRADSL